jgi:hypothetical protein
MDIVQNGDIAIAGGNTGGDKSGIIDSRHAPLALAQQKAAPVRPAFR